MTFSGQLTESQRKRAYRAAVEASLIEFYGVAGPTSRNLVKAWWKRLSDTSAFKSGLFMHAEPMNTAADLIQEEVRPISADIRAAYERVLRLSRDRALPLPKTKRALRQEMKPQSAIAVRERIFHAQEANAPKKAVPQKLLTGRS